MKNTILTSLFFAAILASSEVIAAANTTDNTIIEPTNGKDEQESVKKAGGDKYNFTLFNFFNTTSTSKNDSTSLLKSEPKEIRDELTIKTGL